MCATRIIGLATLAVALTACGGAKNSGGAGNSIASGGLVASVTSPKIEIDAKYVTASAEVKVGGVPGKHLTLEWGLVDALQGNESQAELVVRRYVTTRKVFASRESIRIPVAKAFKPYLVHFVVYAPDGSYLASVDTREFGKGS